MQQSQVLRDVNTRCIQLQKFDLSDAGPGAKNNAQWKVLVNFEHQGRTELARVRKPHLFFDQFLRFLDSRRADVEVRET